MSQPDGSTARLGLVNRIEGKIVIVKFNPYAPDAFGRFVGQIFDAQGDVNLWLIENGAAWFYEAYAAKLSKPTLQSYAAAHARAQTARLGLWAHDAPMSPAVWRATH